MIRNTWVPSPERPISVGWNGSRINIHDIDSLLQDASSQETIFYDRSDFPYPIERVHSSAEIVYPESEEALALKSIVQLDRTKKWEQRWINMHLEQYLKPKKKSSFNVRKATFPNTYLIADDETGSKFILWAVEESARLLILNNAKLSTAGKGYEIRPPATYSASSESQLAGLMRTTALAADLAKGFEEDKPKKIRRAALKRKYEVGQERRTANIKSPSKRTSEVKSKESDDNKRAKENSVDEFKPEEAITLSDIGGLDHVKKALQEVATSFKNPDVMKKWGAKRPQGILLYGEPGTGKTMLARALANEFEADMWALQSSDIYEKWVGTSEQRIKDIFDKVRQLKKPTVLFFDEFDTIVGTSDEASFGGAANTRNAVAGIFKQEMNTAAIDNPNVLIVAATNNLDSIDPSLVRSGRFDYKIYVPMPDESARQEIVINVISKAMLGNEEEGFKVFGDNLNVNKLAKQTEGFSGADITEIFRRLSLSRAMKEAQSGKEQPPITQVEIENAIQDFRTGG